MTIFQDIEENTCFIVYPDNKELPQSSFEGGNGDPSYSLEQKVGQCMLKNEKKNTDFLVFHWN